MSLLRSQFSLHLGTLASAGCLLYGGSALAAGFAIRNQSATGVGTGLASDTVNTADASGLFSNPAVLSELKGNQFSVNANYTSANIEAKNSVRSNTTAAGVLPASTPGVASVDSVSDPVVIPSLFGSHELSDVLTLGWGLTVPWATNTQYDDNWTGRYHATKTRLQVTELTIAGSYMVNSMVNVALAVNAQKAVGEFSSAVDLGLIGFGLGFPGITAANIGAADALSKFEADSTSYGAQFGVLAKPTPELKIGFSYRTQVKHEAKGDLKMTATNPTSTAILSGLRAASPKFADSTDAKLDLTLPSVYSLGAAYTVEAFTVYGNLSYTGWKTFEEFKIEYNNTSSTTKLDWKNSLAVAVGADYRLDPIWTLRAGLSHDKGVTSDERRTPRTPDNDRLGISIGAGYQAMDKLKINAAYQKLIVKETKINLSDRAYTDNNTRGNLQTDLTIDPNIFLLSADVTL